MTRTTIVIAAGLALASTTLSAVPAQAQRARVFVASYGSDSNPCTFLSPCRNFQQAINTVAVGGEVTAIDSAGFGPVSIAQSVTITSPAGVEAGIAAPATNAAAITITLSSTDLVTLSGLTIDGANVSGSTGILFNGPAGGSLKIRDCVIRNFSNFGIAFNPNSSTLSQLFVSNTVVSDNGMAGISLEPFGLGTTTGVLDRVAMENNGTNGLAVNTGTQTINVTVSDSVSANNKNDGIFADSGSGLPASIMVRNSTIAHNGSVGLQASGTGATVRVTRSTITGNVNGWAITASGVVSSYGDNNIDGNGGTIPNPAPPCVNGSSPCSAYK